MSLLPFLAVIMRGYRTVLERSEYSMTVLSHGSARACIRPELRSVSVPPLKALFCNPLVATPYIQSSHEWLVE